MLSYWLYFMSLHIIISKKNFGQNLYPSFLSLIYSIWIVHNLRSFYIFLSRKKTFSCKKNSSAKCAKAPKMRIVDWCTKKKEREFSRLNLSLLFCCFHIFNLFDSLPLKDFSFFVGLSKHGLFSSKVVCKREFFFLESHNKSLLFYPYDMHLVLLLAFFYKLLLKKAR